MGLLSALIGLLGARAVTLEAALILALLLGWPLARLLPLPALGRALGRLLQLLGRKLNRSRRDTATRAWRGAIAVGFIFVPALGLGWWIDHAWPHPIAWMVLFLALLTAWPPYGMIRLWRAARNHSLGLQLESPRYLFADHHALLRFAIFDHATRFAHLVGVAFWYLLTGLAGALGYLALALAAAHYSTDEEKNIAFGGVAVGLFQVIDAIPRRLAALALILAALFVPQASPRAAFRYAWQAPVRWADFIAALLNVTLGGPMPTATGSRNITWAGSGTARLEAAGLGRWLLVWLLSVLVILALALPGLIELTH